MADLPYGRNIFGKGAIHESFPPMGESQPAHQGSQSDPPSKEGSQWEDESGMGHYEHTLDRM